MKGTASLDFVAVFATLIFLGYSLPACGGKGSSTPSSPSGGGTGSVAATVTLTATGVSDAQPRVAVGTRVRFTNSDSRPHQIFTTPHNFHTDCTALNLDIIQPGQSKDSDVLNERRGCGFHDHMSPDDDRFRGQVLVGIAEGEPTPPPVY